MDRRVVARRRVVVGAGAGADGCLPLSPEGINSVDTVIHRSRHAFSSGSGLMRFGASQAPTKANANSIWPMSRPPFIPAATLLSAFEDCIMTQEMVALMLAYFVFQNSNAIAVIVKAGVNFTSIYFHVLMQLVQLSCY